MTTTSKRVAEEQAEEEAEHGRASGRARTAAGRVRDVGGCEADLVERA